ncbi:IS110 family transposase [Solirubrobacter soli]|uniref:IS110 family transposase n=1 Tax=Solirubrobacter soli TaxID=363832 RepID=UPI001FE1FF78|nr:IS110 family transposase [Solirubrobacter soli]
MITSDVAARLGCCSVTWRRRNWSCGARPGRELASARPGCLLSEQSEAPPQPLAAARRCSPPWWPWRQGKRRSGEPISSAPRGFGVRGTNSERPPTGGNFSDRAALERLLIVRSLILLQGPAAFSADWSYQAPLARPHDRTHTSDLHRGVPRRPSLAGYITAPGDQRVDVGIDIHKHIHPAALLYARGGEISTLCFANSRDGIQKLRGWLAEHEAADAVIGVENAAGYGRPRRTALSVTGDQVLNVPAWRTHRGRHTSGPGKSDPGHALAIAL